jgi:type IV pilus assembly protein PilV
MKIELHRECIVSTKDLKLVSVGFSMIEILVALVVLGVGMLGIAALFVSSTRANGSAISRSQAVNLASDMADRIRANRTAGVLYSTISGGATPANKKCTDTPTVVAVNCTVADMAAHDLFLWNASINNTWPAGSPSGTIAVDTTTTPTTYTVTINWIEPNSGALSYSLAVQI